MYWPINEFLIAELYLDQHNIRTPISNADQNALIRDMFSNEHAFDIVKSIVQNGIFPDEFPIGVDENGIIVIIEGNRRLAALKAMSEPSIVPAWEKKIKNLSINEINKIRITLAPNREVALKHIANKHTIDYRRQWKPLRQAYFYKSQLENGKTLNDLVREFPDHNIPRFIKMLEMHHLAKSINLNSSLGNKVHDDRNFPITNLERFYNDKNVGDFLGIEFDEFGKVNGNIAKTEFEKGYKRIVEDVALGTIDSRKFNSAKERQTYLVKIPTQYRPDHSIPGSFSATDFSPLPVQSKSKTKKSTPGKKFPKGLFYQKDLPFNLPSTSLHLMYNELKKIDVANFPNATHDLLRSFLECALVFYLKDTGGYDKVKKHNKHNPTLGEMLAFIASDECTTIIDKNIIQVVNQIKSNWNYRYSLERMNMINHNENWTSGETDVRTAWGKIESLMKILLNAQEQ